MSHEFLIVGAGPTGIALAIELRRFGFPVRLIDKSDHPAHWSQALVVQARTLEQFSRYGIAEQAVERGRKIHRGNVWSNGKLIASLDFNKIPSRFPYLLLLPQSETEQLLIEHLGSLGGDIERKTELIDFENTTGESGVVADLRHSDGRIERTRFRWLIGCDGAHSYVRNKLGVPFEGDTVGLQFSLGDLRLVGPDVPGDELHIHFRRGGDVLFLAKLTENIHRVIVALHEQQSTDNQATPTVEDFNSAFDRYGLQIKAQAATWLAPFHVNQRKANHYRHGSVFLAGDASHVHSPVGGQGMNTGIQDAANLAWKLAAVIHGADERLLDSYDEERGKVGEELLRGTSRGLRMATAANPVVEKLRDVVLHGAAQLDTVQNLIAEAISEISIRYRGSSVVVDDSHGGGPQAGDRMPDAVDQGSGETLLAALRKGGHLLVAVDVPPNEVPREFEHTPVLEVDSSPDGWTPPLKGLLGKGPRIFLVRPDGYIGYRGNGRSDSLLKYARHVGLTLNEPLAQPS